MYAIALAFLVFNRKYSLPKRYHYQVFHAISFMENEFNQQQSDSSKNPGPRMGGQSSLTKFGFTQKKFDLTAEQARIANHKLQKNGKDVIKIVAFAGTGKTTTLIKMCQEHPNLKFLVVMYNADVAKHAREVFPVNATCKTAHALAFQKVGFAFKQRDMLCDNIKAKDIIDSDLMSRDLGEGSGNFMQRAAQIQNTIESFMNSDDDCITTEHVPSRWRKAGSIEGVYK